MQLIARANRGRCSTQGREIHYVSVLFHAPRAESRRKRPDVNVGLVLDRSGSMSGRKIELARKAIDTSIALLQDVDRFAVVVFDDFAETVTPSSHATLAARERARADLAHIRTRGTTDLGGGWLRAVGEVEPFRTPETVTRLIVATDGMANMGMVAPEEFFEQARKLKAKGITTSTIGIGADFDEVLLQGMALHGGGHSYFAEQPGQLLDILAGELGETIEITLRDVVIEATIPAGVEVELLDEFPTIGRPDGIDVALGDLTSEQLVELVFEVALPAGQMGALLPLEFALRAGEAAEPLARARVAWRFSSMAEVAAAPRVPEVDRRAALLIRARTEQVALALNRAGRFAEADQAIERGARKIESLSDDPVVRRVASDLRNLCQVVGMAMSGMASKSLHYGSSSRLRGRGASGAARKSRAPEPTDTSS